IDGKPVVIVFSVRRLREDMGSEAVAAAIQRMRARMEQAGFPGLFLMGVVDDNPKNIEALRAEGYDVGTGYNYPRAGMKDQSGFRGTYDDAVGGYERIWTGVARGGIPYVPVTDPGWDARPWHGDKGLIRSGRTPEKFRDMLVRARRFVDRHPVAGRKKLVLVEAWNEYGEGAAIEPHRQWGFAYLDAIRAVF